MIEMRLLEFKHREILSNLFLRLNSFLSDYSFANLYLFREVHRYRVIDSNGYIFITGVTRDLVEFIMLTEIVSEEYLKALKRVLDYTGIDLIFPVSDEIMPVIEKQLIEASFKDEDTDYLIRVEKLRDYPGRHLSKKRNLVKQFLRDYEVKVEVLDIRFIGEAKKILEEWQSESGLTILETDYRECMEAIDLHQSLNLTGRIVFADRHPVGFAIGEWLNNDCYAIHFGKTLKNIKGIPQFILQDHAFSLNKENIWMNLEQDLGLPLLRQSKHSYIPDKLMRKWRVRFKVE